MMPRRKPQGWPKLMVARRLKGGQTAYYWSPPTWAKKVGCPVQFEALGIDYGTAKARCDDVLNPQFDAWRRDGAIAPPTTRHGFGTFDWMVTLYKSSPKYAGLPPKTRKSYDASLGLVANFELKDGRRFGVLSLSSIQPGFVDRLHDRLKRKSDGSERVRTANLAMSIAKRAWNVARRDKAEVVPANNPFAKMDLPYRAKPTRPVTHDELKRFVAAADADGEPSIGTAAMIAYFWLQRQEDILKRLAWTHYRPANARHLVRVFHHKTGELVELPLFDGDGTELWPELMARLDAMPRRGSLIVTRNQPDRRRKVHLPWEVDYFRHRVAAVREAAGIDQDVKFMGLRHGGNVEGAEADLTDAQLRALSGHLTTAALLRYAQATPKQRQAGARKRLEARTKKD